MTDELYNKYRPKSFKQVFGQTRAVDTLQRLVKANKVPRQLLFVGDSGCGKTTLARIVAEKLGVDTSKQGRDFTEMNASDKRGIDDARALISSAYRKPLLGERKVVLIDEAHRLTGEAQDSLLKLVEEPPSYFHLMLATTNPTKLLKTIQNRCTEIRVELLQAEAMWAMLTYVLDKENKKFKSSVLDKLVEVSRGSARKALVILHSIIDLDDADEQIRGIASADTEAQGIQVARELINNPQPSWKKVAALLKMVTEDPETVRRIILGYCNTIILSGSNSAPRAFKVALCFEDPYYDVGKPGLTLSCWRVCNTR